MTQPASAAHLRAIHTLSRLAGLDEDTRRDLMERETGKRSTKDLDSRQALKVIDCLRALPGADVRKPKPAAKGALNLSGPFVGKVRALWISGWHLGVVRERTDKAMAAFIARQTGIDHPQWVKDPADARKVIEALKKWLERAAGVQWNAEEADVLGAKRAVYLAIRRALTAAAVDPHFNEFPGRSFAPKDGAALDALTKTAGERLRQAKAGGA